MQISRGFINSNSSDRLEGVYIISVAARILEMHPQTLRKYERAGLVRPSRTVGMLRLYSDEDIARLRLIKHLVNELGLNVASVQLVLQLFNSLLNTRMASPRSVTIIYASTLTNGSKRCSKYYMPTTYDLSL